MNELLFFSFALLDLTVVLLLFRFFGKTGLHALIVLSIILCNIQVLKTVQLFGMTTTLGNVIYASIFLTTDILGEFYGKEEAHKGVMLGFAALVIAAVYMQITLLYIPAPSDFIQPHLAAIFSFMPRVAVASLLAYFVSQFHDVWAFHFWKDKTGGRHLWLRNNASTLVSQLLDSVIFCAVAFLGVFPLSVWLQIMLTTYLLKAIMAIMDTPFIYLARRIHQKRAALFD